MSDPKAPDELPEAAGPRRVIGTPPPAEARALLGDGSGEPNGSPPAPRELPAAPSDLRRAKTAERIVAALFILSTLAGIGFIAAYVGLEVGSVDSVFRSNLALGLSMSVVFLALAVGATIWVRHIMPTVELTEERHPMASSPENREAFAETFAEGAEASQFVKRPLLRRTLIAATVPALVAPVVLLRDMGPLPGTTLRHTVWRKGMRLLRYGANTPITPGDFSSPGGMITVVPDGYQDNQDALAAAAAIIIKFQPGVLQPPTVMNWTVDDIVCYSKICTHVGCPAALYEQTTHHILCPCHQSTFDAPRGATVLFGPAPRPLPQLPITTDAQGYLIAKSDFQEPVGPSFWERG
ncbi:MAG TPA: Rieske 2Fe-2S domain-containing protein [Streptosporangiaceae bacterium]|jgi:ubiquinol-cytochrome c reductase iron-sulfur subunit|nr:Rieske 2Fe-2S domain-containing protein [Streptosporangiaceae bacterium]